MAYPTIPDLGHITERITEYTRLAHEYGADDSKIAKILADAEAGLRAAVENINALPTSDALRAAEPDDYESILALRPGGSKKLVENMSAAEYREKLAGAFLMRMAGCTLGAIVEFWSVDAMEDWAKHIGDHFPPVNYWSRIKDENSLRYGKSPCIAYTRSGLNGVPVDDDITYTLLGLLIAEDSPRGRGFTVEDVGASWVKYLPYACTAEDVALKNLWAGVPAMKAAELDNPYVQWIGADIRSDPFGYMAPGDPELAARMAYNDAYISHRRNGIYGEMYISAVIAAAFAVSDPMEALELGLLEIPKDCALARDVRWAIDTRKSIHNYKEARAAVEERFAGMSGVHTNLNACLTIFGLSIGGDDVTRVIGETVAMGYDNDCTAATAGSIIGACVGKKNVPSKWYAPFNDTVRTYMIGRESFKISDVFDRFAKLAEVK